MYGNRFGLDSVAYSFGQIARLGGIGLRQQQGKLFAAITGGDVGQAQALLNPECQFAQYAVTGAVSMQIINLLEVVGINEQAAQGVLVTQRPGDLFLESALKIAAVVQAGQGVGESGDHQMLPVGGVLQADGADGGQAVEEVAGVMAGEAVGIVAAKANEADQLAASDHGQDGDALQGLGGRKQDGVFMVQVGSEPGGLVAGMFGREGGDLIDETDIGQTVRFYS